MFPFNPEYNYLWAVKNSKIPLPQQPHAATKFWQGWENWRTLEHSFARKSQADYDIIASHFHSPCLLVRKNRRQTCTIPTGCGFTQKNRWQKETTKNASHRRPPCHCRYGAALEQNRIPTFPWRTGRWTVLMPSSEQATTMSAGSKQPMQELLQLGLDFT